MSWYVVQTRAGQEKAASKAIRGIGIEVFYPTYCRIVSIGRRREIVVRPLFPLYLFAAFDVDGNAWGGILRTTGVVTVLGVRRPVGFGPGLRGEIEPQTMPISIPDRIVAKLQELAEANGGHIPIMTEDESLPRLSPGQKVRVIMGAFDGFEGLVDRDHTTRVRVLLDILGKSTPTMVDREALRAAQ
jgi:transcription antitermination factor NusG